MDVAQFERAANRGSIGLTEELLFRGLLYRLLEDWRGTRWAIWVSSLGFGLWHVFGQGLLIGVTTFVIGLLFAPLYAWKLHPHPKASPPVALGAKG